MRDYQSLGENEYLDFKKKVEKMQSDFETIKPLKKTDTENLRLSNEPRQRILQSIHDLELEYFDNDNVIWDFLMKDSEHTTIRHLYIYLTEQYNIRG